ncbi:MAG: hypothetical protein LLG44_13575 [Chloroflexi bacterium]|nr:hypothetical protein [Chloroflexota bacterium]
MKLSAEQARTFRTWLTSRGGVLLDCPICRRRDWLAPEIVSVVRSDHASSDTHSTYDEIIVTCALCGYTHHFNMEVINKGKKP